jgi:hypothetical protein
LMTSKNMRPKYWIQGGTDYYKQLGRPLCQGDAGNHDLAELGVSGNGDESFVEFDYERNWYYNEAYGMVENAQDPAEYDDTVHAYRHAGDCWTVILRRCSMEEMGAIRRSCMVYKPWSHAILKESDTQTKKVARPREEKQSVHKTSENNKPEKVQLKKKPKKDYFKRPMPSYLIVKVLQADFVWDCDQVSIWQLKQSDPLFKYPTLTFKQQAKVDQLFKQIRSTEPQRFVTLSTEDMCFLGEGGEECGPCGTHGLTEGDYLLETIAYRISKDDTGVMREFPKQAVKPEVLGPMDFVNGKIAFLQFIET